MSMIHKDSYAPLEKPDVSIVLPAYNVAPYIRNAIESCISQTLSNIEIIVVDDGSVDDTAHIAQSYTQLDKRVVLLRSEKNAGTFAARARGVLHSKGRYVMFLDPDDHLNASAAEELTNTADLGNADLVFFGVTTTPKKIFEWFGRKHFPSRASAKDSVLESVFVESTNLSYGTPGKMYAATLVKQALEALDVSDTRLVYAEDLLLLFAAACFSKKYVILQNELYVYHLHAGSITASTAQDKVKLTIQQIDQVSEILQRFSNSGVVNVLNKYIVNRALQFALRRLHYDKAILESRIDCDLTGRRLYAKSLLKAIRIAPRVPDIIKYSANRITFGRIEL